MSPMLRPALALVVFSMSTTLPTTAVSQEPARPAVGKPGPGIDSAVAAFADPIEDRLDELRGAFCDIAQPVLDRVRLMNGRDDRLTDLKIEVQSAEAAYQNAKLTREVDEIAIKEYDEGIFLQDQATAAGKLKLAESSLNSARQRAADLAAYLEAAKKLASRSLADRVILAQAEAEQRDAVRSGRMEELEVEKARGEIERLERLEAPRRRMELRSILVKAQEVELEKQTALRKKSGRLDALNVERKRLGTVADWKEIVAALEACSRLDHQIRDKLQMLRAREETPAEPSTREIEALLRLAEAQFVAASRAMQVVRVREVEVELSRYADTPGPAASPQSRRVAVEPAIPDERFASRLDRVRETIIHTAGPLIERLQGIGEDAPDIPAREEAIRRAEAGLESARQTCGTCERAIKDYVERIYVRDLAAARRAISLAESELNETKEDVARAVLALQAAKGTAPKTLQEVDAIRGFEKLLTVAKLRERKAELGLEQSKNRLEILDSYEKGKTIKELTADHEKARSLAYGREATLQLERVKLAKDKKRQQGTWMPAMEKAVLLALLGGIRQEAELRARLADLKANGKGTDPDASRELETTVRKLEGTVREAWRRLGDERLREFVAELDRFRGSGDNASRIELEPGLAKRLLEKMRSLKPEDLDALKSATEEQRAKILQNAGFTDAEIGGLRSMRERIKAQK
ncbi:hypothetical protein OJF2_20290 [Aquisphaera giovannonii]|uniref:Chromosome partition protein Smc n=1 Tax=Aquisphaera giovannonii TaxID=406548 RepID=A0A5B9VZX2_9BACT|nr:hypothetical protein [Aquisphaera giovannonii]QEH33527.1 hypothetical protein OJF2_20290 [Aquisphaera giovannonii]